MRPRKVFEGPNNVLIYLRVSTDKQARGVSLEAQESMCRRLAAAYFPDIPIRVVQDTSSGRTGRRPGYARVREEVRLGRTCAVIAYSHDRLSRSAGEFASFVAAADRANVALVLGTTGAHSATPAGRAFLGILGIFAEFESARIGERTSAAIEELERQGRKGPGRRPFGWAVVEGGILSPDAREQAAVDLAQEARRQGRPWGSVAELLEASGVRTVTGVRWTGALARRVVEAALSRRARGAARELEK